MGTWNYGSVVGNTNLTTDFTQHVTSTGSFFGGASGQVGHITSGKFYFQINSTMTSAGASQEVGISNAAEVLNASGGKIIGVGLNGIGIYASGHVFINSVQVGTGAAYTGTGSAIVLDVCIDFSAQLLWYRVANGNWSNSGTTWANTGTADPASGTSGISFSTLNAGPYYISGASSGAQTAGDILVLNDGGNGAFTNTVPTGFSAWNTGTQSFIISKVGTTSWTVPTGVTSVQAEAWGAGGSGGAVTANAGRTTGGGAGAYAIKPTFAVTPGGSVTLQLGAAGTGVSGIAAGIAGNAGTNTFFNSTSDLNALGGAGGKFSISTTAAAAAGALASGCTPTTNAFSGGSSGTASATDSASGGGGAATSASAGANSANQSTSGFPGPGGAAGTGGGAGGAALNGAGTAVAGGSNNRGGGGGGACSIGGSGPCTGGAGGFPGGGGGAAADQTGSTSTSGAGAGGQITLTFTPSAGSTAPFPPWPAPFMIQLVM